MNKATERNKQTDNLLNRYPWKYPIDLLNKPAPIRRIKLVMTMMKIVKAVARDSGPNVEADSTKGTYWYG